MASVAKRKWTYKGQVKEAWVVRYIDENGVHRSKQFEQKKPADAFRRQVEREMDSGVHLADRMAPTVREVCNLYLTNAQSRLDDGRIGRNRYELIRYMVIRCVDETIGRLRFRDVTSAIVEEWYGRLMEGERMNARSARARVRDLKLIEDFAVKRGMLKTRPAAAALSELRGLPKAEIKTFTVDQVHRLLALAATRHFRCKPRPQAWLNCFVNLAAFCGLRRGEIMALSPADVDFDRNVITVRRSLTKWNELKEPKSKAGCRDVPMPAHVAAMMRQWIEHHHVPNDDDLLLTAPSGKPSMANLTQPWEDLIKRANFGPGSATHFHALRHFYASLLIDTGAPLVETAKLLGHAKFDTTLQVYTHSLRKAEDRQLLIDRIAQKMGHPDCARAAQ